MRMYTWSRILLIILVAVMSHGTVAAEQIDATDCKHGEFTHPGYPGYYGNDVHVEWELTTDIGRHIVLTFAEFVLQGDVPGCHNDYLTIFEQGEEVYRGCEDQTQVEYTSETNNVKVIFHSNYYMTFPGFRMLWHPVCDECPLSRCTRTSPDPPCVSYYSCRWGYYLHDFSCPGGSTIQCQDDCYSCRGRTYPECSSLASINPTICKMERETPCGETAGNSIMIQLHVCEITPTISYEVLCSRPCCCNPKSVGSLPGPTIHCGSDINKVYQRPTDCPGFRNIF